MRVLILSPYGDLIEDTVRASGCICDIRGETTEVSDWPQCHWVISFGYRKIIQKRTIEKFQGRIINIHCSLLPWNRGADPNFWSWFDDTPKGVSIHRIDEGIDTGEVLARAVVGDMDFRQPATLRTTYDDLLIAAAGLFKRKWPSIFSGDIKSHEIVPSEKGSYHKVGDMEKFWRFMSKDYDTPIGDVRMLGELYRGVLYG